MYLKTKSDYEGGFRIDAPDNSIYTDIHTHRPRVQMFILEWARTHNITDWDVIVETYEIIDYPNSRVGYEIYFVFAHEKDAMMFTLRWS